MKRIWLEIEFMTNNSQARVLQRTGFDEVTSTTETYAAAPPPTPPKQNQYEVVVQQESIEVPQYTSSPYATNLPYNTYTM